MHGKGMAVCAHLAAELGGRLLGRSAGSCAVGPGGLGGACMPRLLCQRQPHAGVAQSSIKSVPRQPGSAVLASSCTCQRS